jgi:hypothetical protein
MSRFCDVDLSDSSDADDAESVEFFEEKFIVGRKEHACVECRGTIRKDERHRCVSYKFDGRFITERVCPACYEATSEFKHWVLGGLFWQMMREQWAEGARVLSCLNRLSSARAKAKMRDEFWKYQERKIDATVERRRRIEGRRAGERRDPAQE